ncbi:hypothetical protein FLB_01450 [Flavobacterium succinicans]|uniref:Uncharacterized protein n=1 Tax=Flavobacterium succinicans TaxID=29536 RepID=A0A199XW13_9FLAO|nr:hypothetical protein FLB_01450 [Flavobacterium succinicans]
MTFERMSFFLVFMLSMLTFFSLNKRILNTFTQQVSWLKLFIIQKKHYEFL